ncbi:MAG: hypothetical protein ACLFU7_09655 [Armatimonadota bacterium]
MSAEEDGRKAEALADGPRAFGKPGIEPRWTHSTKDGVGTAYSIPSRVWFTLSHGIINEVYSPTIDHPQVRDLELLITDGETFCHEEKRDLEHTIEGFGRDSGSPPHMTYICGSPPTKPDGIGRCMVIMPHLIRPHRLAAP